ncbi:MAG: lysylphosphatidylglycerol synthase transmembrane domain-containing protein [Chloroflexota bacterium]|nr:lysylphosphatidylglycerol synthase transmembrane domain-containing protein [Chloroflexota bacterium]
MRDILPTPPRPHLPPGALGRLILGLILGLGLLAAAAHGVDLGQVRAALSQVRPTGVILALLAVLLTTLAKIGRWRALFPKAEQPGLCLLGRALLVGQLTNALLPVRIGDVVRAYLAGERGRGNRATALGTIATEKVFDVLLLLICAGIAAFSGPLPPWLNVSLAGLAAAGLLLFFLAAALSQRQIMDWMERWSRRLSLRYPLDGEEPGGIGGRLNGILRRGLTGLAALRDPRLAFVACLWSIIVWAVAAATNYLLFWAFDLTLSIGAALLLLVLLHVGIAPPSSPGRLGVFHALTVLGLAIFGIDRSSALAYATVLHLIVYLPQIVLGAIAVGCKVMSSS